MTVLEALAILEAGVLDCKHRNIDTPVMRDALTFLEPHIQPAWLIPQYREHALDHDRRRDVALEGQQQVLRATFPGIREPVRELLGKRMDKLACEFAATHDPKVRDEISRLSIERAKLRETWEFVLR
jgi:hypothetical protein